MNTISSFLVKYRNRIFLIMAAFTLLNLFLMFKVKINGDMTVYLPDHSSMRKGIDILAEEMPDLSMTNTVRVMFENLHEDPLKVKRDLASYEGVSSVSYQSGSTLYEKDRYTLFVLNCTCGFHTPAMEAIVRNLKSDFTSSADQVTYALDDTSRGEVPMWIIGIAIVLIVVILVTMSSSWVESFLFLAAIGMAILINMGTNIILGTISNVTFTIAALLQLVLSMDYSIILMNRFRQELAKQPGIEPQQAMRGAIISAFASISSSSLTTVVGLLAMVFMSFKIGADLGIVLAKGVFISMVCILTILPALILLAYPMIRKTAKKAPSFSFIRAGRIEYTLRYFLLCGFVLLFAAMFLLKGNTDIVFTMTEPSAVDKVFPKSNSIILLYPNEDEQTVSTIVSTLEKEEAVTSVTSYASTLGKIYTARSLAQDAPGLLSSDMMAGMESSLPEAVWEMSDSELSDLASLLTPLLFYEASGCTSDDLHLTMKQILSFLDKQVASASWAEKLLPAETITQIQGASILLGGVLGEAAYSAEELYALINSFYSGMTPSLIILLFDLYDAYEKTDTLPEMTLEDLMLYLGNDLPDNDRLGPLIPEDAKEILYGISDAVETGRASLIGPAHSLALFSTTLPDESPETEAFMEKLNAVLPKENADEYYLLGNTPMAYEMAASFGQELTKMTLITAVAIYVVVLITFKSFLIPLLLVLMIQTAVYATMVIINLQGYSIYYLALLMVQSILMGATIDYAILYTGYYREYRRSMGKKEALSASYRGSMHTITTSGLIITIITWILGYAFPNPTIGEICFTISKGAACSLILIIFLLPGILAALDGWICRTRS